MERQFEGTVEADELYHTAGHKGQKKVGRNYWVAEPVDDARSASLAVATTTKTGQ